MEEGKKRFGWEGRFGLGMYLYRGVIDGGGGGGGEICCGCCERQRRCCCCYAECGKSIRRGGVPKPQQRPQDRDGSSLDPEAVIVGVVVGVAADDGPAEEVPSGR